MKVRALIVLMVCVVIAGCSEVIPPESYKHMKQSEVKSNKEHAAKAKPKALKMQWRHESFIPKKPELSTSKISDDIKPCPTATYKCLSDFNNPAESKIYLKTGDKRSGWHDARSGSLSPSCEIGIKASGFNPTLSMSY